MDIAHINNLVDIAHINTESDCEIIFAARNAVVKYHSAKLKQNRCNIELYLMPSRISQEGRRNLLPRGRNVSLLCSVAPII